MDTAITTLDKKPNALTALPAVLTVDWDLLKAGRPDWMRVRELAALAVTHEARSICYQVVTGLELLRLKKMYPEARGGSHRAESKIFGFWSELEERNVGVSKETARRWILKAEEFIWKLGHNAGGELPPSELMREELPKLVTLEVVQRRERHQSAAQKREAAKRAASPPAAEISSLGAAMVAYRKLSTAERNAFVKNLDYDLRPRLVALVGGRKSKIKTIKTKSGAKS